MRKNLITAAVFFCLLHFFYSVPSLLEDTMKEAKFYEKLPDKAVICNLCPNHCRLAEGKTGRCKVRKNVGGKLCSLAYGRIAAMHIDPIEKKPLYHFLPGKEMVV